MAKQKKKSVKKPAAIKIRPAATPKKSAASSAAAKFMTEISAKAELLNRKRRSIDTLKEKHKRESDQLFAEISKLKGEVLAGLKIVGLKSVKVRGGASYFISKTHGFEIKNPLALHGWAAQKKLVRPDMDLVKQELKKLAEKNELPAFVAPVEGETISYRSNKPKEA